MQQRCVCHPDASTVGERDFFSAHFLFVCHFSPAVGRVNDSFPNSNLNFLLLFILFHTHANNVKWTKWFSIPSKRARIVSTSSTVAWWCTTRPTTLTMGGCEQGMRRRRWCFFSRVCVCVCVHWILVIILPRDLFARSYEARARFYVCAILCVSFVCTWMYVCR